MKINTKLKKFLVSILMLFFSFSTISSYAIDGVDPNCDKNKALNITYASGLQQKRTMQINKRLDFINRTISNYKKDKLDTTKLESESKVIKTKLLMTINSYKSWVDASKAIDCTSAEKYKQTESTRVITHDKAWSSFTDLINYYDKNVRSLYVKTENKPQTQSSNSSMK
jgi:hypothetical protein